MFTHGKQDSLLARRTRDTSLPTIESVSASPVRRSGRNSQLSSCLRRSRRKGSRNASSYLPVQTADSELSTLGPEASPSPVRMAGGEDEYGQVIRGRSNKHNKGRNRSMGDCGQEGRYKAATDGEGLSFGTVLVEAQRQSVNTIGLRGLHRLFVDDNNEQQISPRKSVVPAIIRSSQDFQKYAAQGYRFQSYYNICKKSYNLREEADKRVLDDLADRFFPGYSSSKRRMLSNLFSCHDFPDGAVRMTLLHRVNHNSGSVDGEGAEDGHRVRRENRGPRPQGTAA